MSPRQPKRGKRTAAPRPRPRVRRSPPPSSPPPNGGFPIVGIGASAGGLDAFKKFFDALPADSGMAFVLIQHLDPTHESLTAELLGTHTAMKVEQIVGDTPVRPNHVYVIPPNKYLGLRNGILCLSAFAERRILRMPIDFFLRSLAEDRQEKAVAIILSGMGSDGALGAKEIKGAGGMVLAQEPESALYDGMPRNAIATGAVDHVLPIEAMPEQLRRYVQHPYVKSADVHLPAERGPDQLSSVVALLKARANFNFGPYKKGTLGRRIHRRMGLRHTEQMAEYLALLRSDPAEVKALFKDLLIGVTSFFRDPPAWEFLDREVIRALVKEKEPGATIRAWVPGCSTGEEAYTLAMLLIEQMEAAHKSLQIQIFASDVDRDALDIARAGAYPESIAVDVTPERLRRFFSSAGGWHHVNKELRDAVLFAEQNLITDPPFSKLELISCRNLLIYLDEEVQQKIISLLHFALVDGGCLVLGNAETIGSAADLFETLSKKWRIYRRIGLTRHDRVHFPVVASAKSDAAEAPSALAIPRRLSEAVQRVLVERFVPASVVINRHYEILHYSGATNLYLAHPPGPPTQDLLAQARDGLQTKLRNALRKAIGTNQPVAIGGLRVRRNGASHAVAVAVEPLREWKETAGLLLVSFTDEPETPPAARKRANKSKEAEPSVLRQLEEELRSTREDLQSTIHDLETSNEELKAANEEVMSVNEELQSTNEELETSKEELQSLNEELSTVNTQLQSKVDELGSTNNDLDNLLTSTNIATVFLDRRLRIKRYTPAATRLFNLIDSDRGRPMTDIAQKFTDPELLRDAESVLTGLTLMQREVEAHDGRSYVRQVLPYRTQDNRIDGVVITFSDVAADALHAARSGAQASDDARRESEDRLRTILETAADGIVTIDERGIVHAFNRAAEQAFGYTAAEVLGQNVSVLMPPPHRGAHDRYLANYLQSGVARIIGIGRELIGRRKDGSLFPLDLAVSEFHDGATRHFTGIVRDITQRKEAEQRERERQAELAHIQRVATTGELVADLTHQLSQPLSAIANDLHACALQLGMDNLPLVRTLLGHASEQVMRAGDVISHVRQFMRKREPVFEVTDLRQVAHSVVDLLRGEMDPQGISLEVDLGADALLVCIDPVQIEQVIFNLVRNAVEALVQSAGEKTLRIRAAHAGAKAVELVVVDSGPGISEETKSHLFESFYTTKPKGLGMGLLISRSIAEAHDGTLSLSSRTDGREGAVARLLLPLQPGTGADEETEHGAAATRST